MSVILKLFEYRTHKNLQLFIYCWNLGFGFILSMQIGFG